MTNQLVLLFFLLVLSGFFSSSETALFSISRSKARFLAKQPGKANMLINHMKGNPHRLLSTILIGNNIVNVAASALATAVTLQVFPHYAVGLATGVMTLLILVFGEVFPKSIATRNNVLVARFVIFPIYWLSIIFRPIVFFLDFIPKLTGRIQRTPSVTEEELITFVEVVREQGEIKEEEHRLINRIFEFDDTNASEIMTPRADMFVIQADAPLDLQTITDSGFTRIPVIEQHIDNIVGILNIKDILAYHAKNKELPGVRELMRAPYFVPEHKKADSLLKQFQKLKAHMAIVVDEHGGVAGLITLEDALEELVGDIRDETDKDEKLIVKRKNTEWLVMGKTDIEEVNEMVGMNIPDSPEYDTFSGFVLEQIGRIPAVNEEFLMMDNFQVVVKSKDGNRIKEYVVRKIEKQEPEVEPQPVDNEK